MASKASPQRVRGADQRRLAMGLRNRERLTFEEIGERLGVTKQTAFHHVKRALAEARAEYREEAQDHIDTDVATCDAILAALAPTMADPRTANAMIAVMERRSKLLGLDAPNRNENQNVNREVAATPADMARAVAEIRGCSIGEATTFLLEQSHAGANGTTTTTLALPAKPNGSNGANGQGGH